MRGLIGISVALLIVVGMASTTQAAKPMLVGAKKCKACHMSKKKGNQFGIWTKSAHANAYTTLGTPEAKEAAKKAGLSGDPQKSKQCLKCHTPSVNVKAELIADTYDVTQGVQCESCHGGGSAHVANMKKRLKTKDTTIPLVIEKADEKLCVTCHNSESPSFKSFSFEEFWPKIAHPLPEKAGSK